MKLNILFLITFLSVCNVSIAQSLKTYSGKYQKGTATYSYNDNPAGGRIYEGDFVYTAPHCKIAGQFKNNKKNGQWIYEGYKQSLKLSYKDGVLDGMYQFIRGGDNIRALLLTIKDGKFVGSAKGTDIGYTWNRLSHYRGSFSGQFDENGYMDGDWTFKEDDDSIYVFHATYEHGVCRKCYREDITTGDIAEGAIKIDLHSIIIDNLEIIEGEVSRGHSRWNRYDYEIGQKSSVSDAENAIRRKIQEVFERRSSAVGTSSRSINTVGVEGSGYGGYGIFDLSERSLVRGLPRPRHNVAEEGRVVVDITVNPAGYVIATSINARTNTPSTDLRNAAMEAAQKARFNAIDGTGNQVGTITFNFQLR